MAVLLSVPFLMAIAPIFFASFYLSYRDVFVEVSEEESEDHSPESPRQEPISGQDGSNAAS